MTTKVIKILKSPSVITLGLFFVFILSANSQSRFLTPSDTLIKSRGCVVKGVGVGGGASVLAGVGVLWYADHDFGKFRFFNDNDQWLLMDKLGHGMTAYYGGYFGYKAMKWAGYTENKSVLWGGLYGFSFLLGVEVLDGFSDGWGASPGDLLANSLGTGLFVGQQKLFKEQRILVKYSYWSSPYAQYRPEILGKSHWERWLKDYNGQTYWLSFNLNSFGLQSKFVPKWLNLAVGYSGDGMLGGDSNPSMNSDGELLPQYSRSPEWFLSLDIDLRKLNPRSSFLKSLFETISFVKIPFPAIRLNKGEISLKGLHW